VVGDYKLVLAMARCWVLADLGGRRRRAAKKKTEANFRIRPESGFI
jgi:hypothetical protein